MAIKTDMNKMLLDEIQALYGDAEAMMLEKVARRTKRGVETPGFNEEKLNDIQSLRKEITMITSDTNLIAKRKVSQGILDVYKAGAASASKDARLAKTALTGLIPQHVQRMVLETNALIDGTSFQILRSTQDVYRQVMAEATTGLLIGTQTRLQAAQDALNRFAAKGITSFVDKAGRKWEMGAYVDMAVRTTSARAALQGHIDRQLEIDNDLIRVSGIGATCPICANWQGKVLSITGKTPGYPSLDDAKADGLFHPNCKHTVSAYFPDVPGFTPKEFSNDPEKYKQVEQQRNNERNIRKWKRVEAVALSPAAKSQAAAKVAQWQARQRQLISDSGLKRKYGREGGSAYKDGKAWLAPTTPPRIVPLQKAYEPPTVWPKDPAPKPAALSEMEEAYKNIVGGDPKVMFKLAEVAATYEKWVRKEIKSLGSLDFDKKNMSLTDVYKKYIGDTPSQDYKAAGITDKPYAKWLKEQVQDIGVGYKIKIADPPPPPPSPVASSTLSPTEKYKKYVGGSPAQDFKKLGITDKSYAKWLKEVADEAERKAAGAAKPPAPALVPKPVAKVAKKPEPGAFKPATLKPVESTKAAVKAPAAPLTDDEKIQEHIRKMPSVVDYTKAFKNTDIPKKMKENIANHFNSPAHEAIPGSDNYRKLLATKQNEIKYVNADSSFYSPSKKTTNVEFYDDVNGIRGKLIITGHETGHALDAAYNVLSYDHKLFKALEDDYNDLLKQSYDVERNWTTAKTRLNNILRSDAGEFVKQSGAAGLVRKWGTNGVSDTLSGLSHNEVKGNFAHDNDYWDRRGTEMGKKSEISSEFFAHAAASMSSAPHNAYMMKMLPKSMERFNKIIEEYLVAVSKDALGIR